MATPQHDLPGSGLQPVPARAVETREWRARFGSFTGVRLQGGLSPQKPSSFTAQPSWGQQPGPDTMSVPARSRPKVAPRPPPFSAGQPPQPRCKKHKKAAGSADAKKLVDLQRVVWVLCRFGFSQEEKAVPTWDVCCVHSGSRGYSETLRQGKNGFPPDSL